ncbi:MAG TPA: DUF1697 domain-containing protein [Gemmatimonadaceae bacterium]|nr:DUF1697 domain-containing protein [Gemmatimonadaceae bacterium]
MTRYIAFLRAINVGGHTVTMQELRALFEALGFSRVETFIASGNVIFESDDEDAAALERGIEAHLRARLGYDVVTFLRTDAEVAAIARYRAFDDALMPSAITLNVAFLHAPLGTKEKRLLADFQTGIDDFHAHGREMYWLCRTRQSDSTFSNAKFEKALGVRTTFRGVKTVARLAAKYSPMERDGGPARGSHR